MSSPTVLLLAAESNSSENDWARPDEEPFRPRSPGRRCVLVVDDDDTLRVLIARVLEEDGYEVHTAPDGTSALGAVFSNAHAFDLVITDIRMPGMDGWELGRRIQRERPTPILYVTGYDIVRAPASHLTFLRKPFEPEALLDRVRRLLDEG